MAPELSQDLSDFDSYKTYLKFRFSEPLASRRSRSGLASHLSCHPGYVSQVLNGKAHLSLEQAERANHYLKHSPDEAELFLLLVLEERAGTSELKKIFRDQRNRFLDLRNSLGRRLEMENKVASDVQPIYYSSWRYAAIHVALWIPNLRSVEKISAYLNLSEACVREVLRFFIASGMAKTKSGEYHPTLSDVHLAKDSPHLSRHHCNWRLRAIRAVENNSAKNFHYSGALTLSRADAEKLRERMTRDLKSYLKTARGSSDEVVFGMNLDFFPLGE